MACGTRRKQALRACRATSPTPSSWRTSARAQLPALVLDAAVQGVDFLDGAALATVMVTHTLRQGGVIVQPELRFYVQTPKGWQRSKPLAAFWGPTATLDTESLHFVFGGRDRAVVAPMVAGGEALYATLRLVTGQELATGGLVAVEIVPGFASSYAQLDESRIRLTSPSLYRVGDQERGELLGQLLRRALCEQLMAAVAQRTPATAQWQPMVQAFGSWLEYSDAIEFAPGDEAAALRRLVYRMNRSWHLGDLQGDVLRYDPATRSFVAFTLVGDLERQRQRLAAAEQLIDFIAGQYGIDVLPKLLQGFAQYEDWEDLAPAVLGVSAAELEHAWHSVDVSTFLPASPQALPGPAPKS